jgi:predicted proteasome-type protease
VGWDSGAANKVVQHNLTSLNLILNTSSIPQLVSRLFETMSEVSSRNKQRWWKEAIVYQVCFLFGQQLQVL